MKESVETRSEAITRADRQLPAQKRPSADDVELGDSELEKVAGAGGPPGCSDCGCCPCQC